MTSEGIGPEFLLKTSGSNIPRSQEDCGDVPQPPLELPYPVTAGLIDLPEPANLLMLPADLRTMIEQRRTLRKYDDKPLTLEELSYLLWCTQGVQRVTSRPVTLRTVPSAGARHAFETLLLVNRVEGFAPGLYRYIALEHALLRLEAVPEIAQQLMHACLDQSTIINSAVTFAWVAVTARMTWRYSARGYRYLFLDAGHVCQNLYLSAEAIGCGVCAIAAYDDQETNSVLGVDGAEQFVIYLATVGKRIIK